MPVPVSVTVLGCGAGGDTDLYTSAIAGRIHRDGAEIGDGAEQSEAGIVIHHQRPDEGDCIGGTIERRAVIAGSILLVDGAPGTRGERAALDGGCRRGTHCRRRRKFCLR